MKRAFKKFKLDNRGIGTVEIILILVILIAIVILFRDQIGSLVNRALTAISGKGSNIIDSPTGIIMPFKYMIK